MEALWSVEFFSNLQSFGTGVAVLETGRLLGGDTSFTYIGDYEVNGGEITATVTVKRYSDGNESIFGPLDEFVLVGRGETNPNEVTVAGTVKNNPDLKIVAKFRRVAELP